MNLFFILLLSLSGCASSRVPFQKSSEAGYTVEEKGPGNLIVKTHLPGDLASKVTEKYIIRAVGEECLQRGFKFFDFTAPVNGTSEGFCFQENKRKAFAITFEVEGLKSNPPVFIIENMNQKSKTNLLPGDKIIRVEGKDLTSVSELKSLAFAYGVKNKSEAKIELLRQGKAMTVKEPFADMSNGAFGPEDLEDLRR